MIFLREGLFLYPKSNITGSARAPGIHRFSVLDFRDELDPYLGENTVLDIIKNIDSGLNQIGEFDMDQGSSSNTFLDLSHQLETSQNQTTVFVIVASWDDSFKILKRLFYFLFGLNEEDQGVLATLYIKHSAQFLEVEKERVKNIGYYGHSDGKVRHVLSKLTSVKSLPKSKIGFEFQLLHLLKNDRGDENLKFEERALHIVKKQLITDYLREVGSVLALNHFRIQGISDGKIITFKDENQFNWSDIVDRVRNGDLPLWMADPLFNADNVSHVWNNYDLNDLVSVRDSLLTLTDMSSGEVYKGISSCLFKRDLSFGDVLKFEAESGITRVLFNRFQYDRQINPFIVDWALSMHRASIN
tara:strand:+ start:53953 stop:55026 length:1074 start_codon:yes stop_codon:yes gene_type:complete